MPLPAAADTILGAIIGAGEEAAEGSHLADQDQGAELMAAPAEAGPALEA